MSSVFCITGIMTFLMAPTHPVTLLPNGSGYFRANLFLYKYFNYSTISYFSYPPAYENGTDSVFRNIGI
jgi:hypothetical protein